MGDIRGRRLRVFVFVGVVLLRVGEVAG
jgi:hypothetical protein